MNLKELVTGKPGDKQFLLGNEAVVRGVIEAGVSVAATYPGTPSSEIALICFATARTVASSNPVFFGPARASPLNFNKTLFISMLLSCLICILLFYHTPATTSFPLSSTVVETVKES